MTLSVAVSGMSCGHCAAAIKEQVLPLQGVEEVEVDVPAGRVTVSGGPALQEAQVRAAIVEAGYEVVAA
ncbi:heavy-metal-associated domain-containing protein [Nonomuraea sp. NPDC050153]|uniref:heavy-metal-associated domain-containing protein n=1 Tax=Nonomuraea sp. NPDC050153 TaxID=3364359 RepID=UPI003793BBA0